MSDEPAKRLTPALVAEYAKKMRVGPEDYIRLLGTFLSRNAERIAELRTAITSRDQETAARMAHSIKGTALTLRLAQMAEQAERLEGCLLKGELDGLADVVTELEVELNLISRDAQACH